MRRDVVVLDRDGTEQALAEIHARLIDRLAEEGGLLAGVYVCPHATTDACQCRKPATGLLERAAREHGFDRADAFVIGDKRSDVELGRRAGSTTLLVRTGYGATEADPGVTAGYIAKTCVSLLA
jgi:D-glycero-D-manno-heptose 1,7-bisphosphate phosphatase